jgi:hypothetical protein
MRANPSDAPSRRQQLSEWRHKAAPLIELVKRGFRIKEAAEIGLQPSTYNVDSRDVNMLDSDYC